jgi:dTDP-glucose pyrophosphorylase
MKSVGVKEVYIIVGMKKEIIEEYFGNGEDFGLHICYIEQSPPRGIAHAISLTRSLISEPFAVILGDDLTITRSLNNIVKTFWEKKAIVVEGAVFENNVDAIRRACCVVLKTDGQITEITEKPLIPKSNLRGTGVYLFDPKVFDYIEKTPVSTSRNEKEITETIGLISKEGNAYAALIKGLNINVNTSIDLTNATKILLKIQNLKNKSLLTRMKK